MNNDIPDCDELLRKFAGIFRAPKHVQRAFFENPALHKRLSSAGGRAPKAKKKITAPKPL